MSSRVFVCRLFLKTQTASQFGSRVRHTKWRNFRHGLGSEYCLLVYERTGLMLCAQWAACALMAVFISLAMGELGSAMPTSGGLYYWTFAYSSVRWRCFTSWLVGCELLGRTIHCELLTSLPATDANTIGLIAGVASVDWGLAIQIMAAASIGSDMTFTPSTAQV